MSIFVVVASECTQEKKKNGRERKGRKKEIFHGHLIIKTCESVLSSVSKTVPK